MSTSAKNKATIVADKDHEYELMRLFRPAQEETNRVQRKCDEAVELVNTSIVSIKEQEQERQTKIQEANEIMAEIKERKETARREQEKAEQVKKDSRLRKLQELRDATEELRRKKTDKVNAIISES